MSNFLHHIKISVVLHYINISFAAVGALLGAFLGGLDGMLWAILGAVAMDYVTGVMVALKEKKLSSEVGFVGILRKITILFLVGFGHLIDVNVIQTGDAIRTAIIMFYVANEGISILENASKLGLPIPKKLKALLQQLKTENDTPEKTEVNKNE